MGDIIWNVGFFAMSIELFRILISEYREGFGILNPLMDQMGALRSFRIASEEVFFGCSFLGAAFFTLDFVIILHALTLGSKVEKENGFF